MCVLTRSRVYLIYRTIQDFWRGDAYSAYFDYLDKTGNFYYERWGDAPVHSIAAALFLSKNQIHFFDEIGYEHNPYTHCPSTEEAWKRGKCGCNREKSFGASLRLESALIGSLLSP
jgi:alpha 1,2-mannosyltransferase